MKQIETEAAMPGANTAQIAQRIEKIGRNMAEYLMTCPPKSGQNEFGILLEIAVRAAQEG